MGVRASGTDGVVCAVKGYRILFSYEGDSVGFLAGREGQEGPITIHGGPLTSETPVHVRFLKSAMMERTWS